METILSILQWVIPSGGIGGVIGWFANRKANKAKTKKEIHDTFQQMYEDVSKALLDLQKKYDILYKISQDQVDENTRTRRALNRLSRAVEAIPLCDYHSQCPVLNELRIDKEGVSGGHSGAAGKPDADGQHETGHTGGGAFPHADAIGDRLPPPHGIIPDRKPAGNGHVKKEGGRKRNPRAPDGGTAGGCSRDDDEYQHLS